MNRETILSRLCKASPELKRKFETQSLSLLGSIARSDDHDRSDVDILVTFEGPATFDALMELRLDLEDLTDQTVDLGTPDSLRPEMRAAVERDLVHLA